MSKKDAVKSKISAFISAMVVFLTALLAVIGFAFVNYEKMSFAKGCAMIAGIVALIALFCATIWLLSKEIKRLEKMK